MHILEHLFLTGEFRERADLLSGLTLEQVRLRPDGASHSIYDELWHAAACQRSVLERGEARRGDRRRVPARGARA
jgi:DinB family protein